MNNKRLMKVFGLLLVIGLLAVISPLTRAQARTTDTFSISDWNIDGLAVDDSGRPVISPQSGTPTIDPIPDQTIDEHVELTFVVHATPQSTFPNTNLQYSLVGAPIPIGATITKTDNEHAIFRWTPAEGYGPSVNHFSVRVCETAGIGHGCATTPVQVTVNEVNVAPVLDPLEYESEVNELELMSFTASASDADVPPQALVFSLENGDDGLVPEGASIATRFDEEDGKYYGDFTWTPSETQGPGEYTFDVCVSDGTRMSDCETITVTVTEVNVAPVLASIGDKTIAELALLSFNASATDADLPSQTLVFSLADGVEGEVPEGAVITAAGAFSWTPTEAQGPGEYTFDVCVSDGVLSDCETITVTVSELNVAPVLAPIGDKTIAELALLSFNASATDADLPSQTLVFSLADGVEGEVPEGAVITAAGAFSWTPTEAQGPGEYTFDVCVSDGVLSDCETITVTVSEVNVAPVLAEIGDQEVDELDTLEFVATATDADIPVQTLVFSLAGEVPEGAVITAAGAFSWTPSDEQGPGEYTFDVCVSDGALSDCETITVTVNAVNKPPVAEDMSVETMENQPVEIELFAIDPDGDLLSFDIVLDPEHGTLECEGPLCTYTPEAGWSGTDSFTYIANDGELDSNEATVEITVHPLPVFRIYLPLILK